jgi:DNA-binding NtrC family response regulator
LSRDSTLTDDQGDLALGEAEAGFHLLVMSRDVFATHPLPATGTLVIGRSASVDIQLQDPLASRRHARLSIGETIAVEDLGSANGTRVRDALIESGLKVDVGPGEAIVVGTTCLMVQNNRSPLVPRRLWSHTYFENRLEEECARASLAGTSFEMARIHVDRRAPWMHVAPILVREIKPPHLLAAYGPNEYEVLFYSIDSEEADHLLQSAVESLADAGFSARWGAAWFPRDGRSPDALISHACLPLRSTKEDAIAGEVNGTLAGTMQRVNEVAARAAEGNINVLLLGETGVGKEVLAQRIHRLSPRADKPILCVNCAGLTESLLESELFGYEKGAFTGATQAKPGLFETAQGGTVFLDEVGELPLVIQAKLLRVIDGREVMRLGGLKARPIDVRFISATNRDIEAEVQRGTFRRDLFFRLNGISLTIPPLRQRLSEIPALCEKFLANACVDFGRKPEPVISARAATLLRGYSWPGNIRELRNVIERAVVLCTGFEIGPEHLPIEKIRPLLAEDRCRLLPTAPTRSTQAPPEPETRKVRSGSGAPPPSSRGRRSYRSDGGRGSPRDEDERQRIVDALAACAGNQSRAAMLLGMPRRTFVAKLAVYAIPRPQKL